jgi:hypothetical protein
MHITFILHSYYIHITFILHSYSIHIPFILHSYSIQITFRLHSYSIHITFIFHSYSIHITFIFHSYYIHITFIFHSYSIHITFRIITIFSPSNKHGVSAFEICTAILCRCSKELTRINPPSCWSTPTSKVYRTLFIRNKPTDWNYMQNNKMKSTYL